MFVTLTEELVMFHYVSKILSNGEEFFEDVPYGTEAKTLAENAVRKAKITTSRVNPKTCTVEVRQLVIKLGNIEKRLLGTVILSPPFAPMTDEEYKIEMQRILKDIPTAFHNFITNQAWEDGHSAGFEEVVKIAIAIVNRLKPSITQFEKEFKKPVLVDERVEPCIHPALDLK